MIVDSSRDIQLMYDKDYMVGELEMAADGPGVDILVMGLFERINKNKKKKKKRFRPI